MTEDQLARFWAKVDTTAGPEGCWPWAAYVGVGGHGMFKLAGRPVGAHRLSYELAHGPVPDGLRVAHRCGTRRCVNPAHLRTVTRGETSAATAPTGRSGLRGVWQSGSGWTAAGRGKGRTFDTIWDADRAALLARQRQNRSTPADLRVLANADVLWGTDCLPPAPRERRPPMARPTPPPPPLLLLELPGWDHTYDPVW